MQCSYNRGSLPKMEPARLFDLKQGARWLVNEIEALDIEGMPISEHGRDCLTRARSCLEQTIKKYVHILAWGLAAEESGGPEAIVDYGGGHGLLSCLAKAAGVAKVIYNDIFPQSLDDARALGRRLGCVADSYVCGDIQTVRDSFGSRFPSSCTLVSVNVIEHIYDLRQFLRVAGSLSSKRMSLVLSTSANPLNFVVRRRHFRQHREWEFTNGPHESSGPMDSVKAFRAIREDMVRDYAPILPEPDVSALATATRGKRKEDIERSVRYFLRTGRLPQALPHPTNTCDPVTGNWQERLLDIDGVCRDLSALGFSTKVFGGYYNDTASNPAKRAAAHFLNWGISLLGGRAGARLAPCIMFCGYRECSP